MRSHFCHIQVQFSALLFRVDKLLNNCLTNVQEGRFSLGALRSSPPSCGREPWCSFLRHTRASLLPAFLANYSSNFNQKHLPAAGFRMPLSSCGGSLLISVLLRRVALHSAKELLLLLDVLLLSPSACLPGKPKSKITS